MSDKELLIVDVNADSLDGISNIIPEQIAAQIKNNEAYAFAAIEDDATVGVMSMEFDEANAVLNILDIYTVEDNRRNGIAGTLLLETIDNINEQMDYSLNYAMAAFEERNTDAMAFFTALGFETVTEMNSFKTTYTLENIRKSLLMEKQYKLDSEYHMLAFEDIDNIRYRAIRHTIAKSGGYYDMDFAVDMDKSLSTTLWRGDELIGLAEIIIEKDGSICLGQFFAVKSDTAVLAMLQSIALRLMEKYSADTEFSVYITAESSGRFLSKLLGDSGKKECLVKAVLNLTQTDELNEWELEM